MKIKTWKYPTICLKLYCCIFLKGGFGSLPKCSCNAWVWQMIKGLSDHYKISVLLNNTTKKLHVEVWVLAHYAILALNVIFTSRELTFMFSAISVYFWYTSWNWLGHFPVFEPADLIYVLDSNDLFSLNLLAIRNFFGIFDKSIRKLPFTREVMSQIL